MPSGSAQISEERIYEILSSVCDPEIPVLTIEDLGILRSVERAQGKWKVTITPTYSGCPAMNMIEMNIRAALDSAGIEDYEIISSLDPAWTTEWMSEEGKKKLKEYGIAPPQPSPHQAKLFGDAGSIECPRCGSSHTELVSQFGSTACKSLYRCLDCKEPFDYFKCH